MIKNIQTLRAIAANGILLSHLVIVEQKYSHIDAVLSDRAHFGDFGVDLFFVISGFIMATITKEGSSPTAFLISRARRILPPYWFYTTLVLAVSLYAPAMVNSSFGQPPSVWRSYLLIPDQVPPLLAVGWTLIHESYFYLCFALLLVLIRSFRFTLPGLLLIWTAAIVCLNAAFHIYGIADPVAAVVAHPLTLEFILGAAVGILIQRKVSGFAASALLAGIGMLAIVLMAFPDTVTALITDRGWTRVLLIGAPCVLIVYGAVAMERRGMPVAPGWLVALGDTSYSTYLSHVLVLSAIGRLSALIPIHSILMEVAFVITCVVAANAAGLVSGRLIERRR